MAPSSPPAGSRSGPKQPMLEGRAGTVTGSQKAPICRFGGLWSAAVDQWHDGIGDSVGGGVVDAADGAGVVDDAVGLTALEHGQADQRPPVDELAFDEESWAKSGSLKT